MIHDNRGCRASITEGSTSYSQVSLTGVRVAFAVKTKRNDNRIEIPDLSFISTKFSSRWIATNVYDFCRCSNREPVLVSDLRRKLSKSKTIPTVDRGARFVPIGKEYHTFCIIQNV